MKVKDVMYKKIITLMHNDTVAKALGILEEHRINGAPVVNQEGYLEGMIVKSDIYRFLIAPGHYESCPVDWVMSKNVIVANEEESILVVAKRLRQNEIVAIPVVDENNKVLGIITIEGLVDHFLEVIV